MISPHALTPFQRLLISPSFCYTNFSHTLSTLPPVIPQYLCISLGHDRFTAHSASTIPVNQVHLSTLVPSLWHLLYLDNSKPQSNIKPNSQCTCYIAVADFSIFKEMPMEYKSALDSVDELLKRVTGNNSPFGGKSFFRNWQLLPSSSSCPFWWENRNHQHVCSFSAFVALVFTFLYMQTHSQYFRFWICPTGW